MLIVETLRLLQSQGVKVRVWTNYYNGGARATLGVTGHLFEVNPQSFLVRPTESLSRQAVFAVKDVKTIQIDLPGASIAVQGFLILGSILPYPGTGPQIIGNPEHL